MLSAVHVTVCCCQVTLPKKRKTTLHLQVGFLLFLATCVMTAGAASLVILPMHLYR